MILKNYFFNCFKKALALDKYVLQVAFKVWQVFRISSYNDCILKKKDINM